MLNRVFAHGSSGPCRTRFGPLSDTFLSHTHSVLASLPALLCPASLGPPAHASPRLRNALDLADCSIPADDYYEESPRAALNLFVCRDVSRLLLNFCSPHCCPVRSALICDSSVLRLQLSTSWLSPLRTRRCYPANICLPTITHRPHSTLIFAPVVPPSPLLRVEFRLEF